MHVRFVHRNPRTVDAVLAFHSLVPHDLQYSIRVNHTSVIALALLQLNSDRGDDSCSFGKRPEICSC